MENHRRRSTELPDVIIQHIHSFLETNEAAQTILVSKSWLRAWSSRPFLILNLHRSWLKTKTKYIGITSQVIDRTLESYVHLGKPIVRFHLHVETIQERWLKMARQCNVIELHLRADYNWTDSTFQEIFATKSLQVLTVVCQGFRLSSNLDVKCVNLKKLELHHLVIDELTFQGIMSSCPLIQELMIFYCRLIDPPSYNLRIQSFIYASEYASLKRLSLEGTQINDDLLQTILSKSVQLEDFRLAYCNKLVKTINLSSVTLKRVNFDRSNVQLVLIDAPNLCKLKYKNLIFITTAFPITITSPVTKGTVKVTIVYSSGYDNDKSLFIRLRELLGNFAKSNVKFTSGTSQWPLWSNYDVSSATRLPPLNEVETLRFKGYKELQLLYAFFTMCHPKIVLLDHLDTMSERKLLKIILNELSYRGNLGCCKFNDENKCWRHYIVDAKLYYAVDNEKKPLDLSGLEIETGLGNKEVIITLALEWQCFD